MGVQTLASQAGVALGMLGDGRERKPITLQGRPLAFRLSCPSASSTMIRHMKMLSPAHP